MSLSMDTIGEVMFNSVSESLGIFFVMFSIVYGTGKLWSENWNVGIKFTMFLVVLITEMACIALLPFKIGGKTPAEYFGDFF